jgi:hypothetical protein
MLHTRVFSATETKLMQPLESEMATDAFDLFVFVYTLEAAVFIPVSGL